MKLEVMPETDRSGPNRPDTLCLIDVRGGRRMLGSPLIDLPLPRLLYRTRLKRPAA
jgi:hypothetical protein